jgi:hypothetical protein
MAGKVQSLIDQLIRVRGGPKVEPFVRAHLMMKGIDPDAYRGDDADDPDAVAALERMIAEFARR